MESIQPTSEESPAQGRPNRIAPVLRILAYMVIVFIAMVVVGSVVLGGATFLHIKGPSVDVGRGSIPLPVLAVSQLVTACAVLLVTLGFVIFADHRPADTLGINGNGRWAAEILLGIGLGIGMIGLMFLISYLMGWSRVTGSLFAEPAGKAAAVVVESIVFMIGVGISEEVMMRGYVLQNLKFGYGAAPALIISSIVFGLLHSANPGASFSGFVGTTAAGFLLGYAYLATGSLWMPIAIHFAWNFAEGPIFGFPVSGAGVPGWIQQTFAGPMVWTGGRFGPEAGLMTPIVLALGAAAIWWFSKSTVGTKSRI